jgi:hypothetical protein
LIFACVPSNIAPLNPPRLVLHAAVAGLFGALAIGVLLRIVHPASSRTDWVVAMIPVTVVYTLVAAFGWPLLYGAVRFFASQSLRVPRFSLRYLLTFHFANIVPVLASLAVLLTRARRAIDVDAEVRLHLFLGAMTGAWLYTGIICLLPRLKRSQMLQASALGVCLAALLAPALLRGDGGTAPSPDPAPPLPRPQGRLVWINLDGGDLEDVLGLQAKGKLPALSRLRREGTYGRLDTLSPCTAPVTRTALVTGRLPWRTGVRGDFERRLADRPVGIVIVPPGLQFDALLAPFMERRPLTVADRRGPSVWDVVEASGGAALQGGWEIDLDRGSPPSEREAKAARRTAAEFSEGDASFAEPAAEMLAVALARGLRADEKVEAVLARALEAPGPALVALSFPGLDAVAHRFLRVARPATWGNVTSDEEERYGRILERYYARLDALVGRARTLAGRDGWIFVTSSHGMEPAPMPERLLLPVIGIEPVPGSHERDPGGFLFAAGPGVRAGNPFGRGGLADVAPTALYLLGLPIARDIDGSILDALLQPEAMTERPAVIIDRYGDRVGTPP